MAARIYQLFPDLGSKDRRLKGIFKGAKAFYWTLCASRRGG